MQRCLALATAGAVPIARSADAAERAFQARIVRRRVEGVPATIRVTVGDRVDIRWTTDEATTLHVHGYDVALPVDPGTESRMRFDATATGRYPISAHGFGVDHGNAAHREVVLLWLEVHPR